MSWTSARRRRCSSTTPSRTPRTAPVSWPTGRTPSRCAPCSPTSCHPESSVGLDDLVAKMVEAAAQPEILSTVVPPDLHDQPGVDSLLAGEHTGSRETWSLISERLVFAAVMETGLRSRQGRTLELTRSVGVEVALDDPAKAAAICRDVHVTGPGQLGADRTGRRSLSRLPPRAARTAAHPGRGLPRVAGAVPEARRHPVAGLGRPTGRHARFPERRLGAGVPPRGTEVPLRVRRDHRARQLVPGLDLALPRHGSRRRRQLPVTAAAGLGRRRHRRRRRHRGRQHRVRADARSPAGHPAR